MAHETVVISGTGDTARLRRILEEHGYTVRQSADAEPRSPADTTVELADSDADEWTWRDDHEAYERNREALSRDYAGRFIAMHRGEVVGVGEDARDAARDGVERLGYTASLFVIEVGKPLPEPEELDMQMETPRGVQPEQ